MLLCQRSFMDCSNYIRDVIFSPFWSLCIVSKRVKVSSQSIVGRGSARGSSPARPVPEVPTHCSGSSLGIVQSRIMAHVEARPIRCMNPKGRGRRRRRRPVFGSTLHKGIRTCGGTVGLGLAVAAEEEGEGLHVVVEAELAHGPQHVVGGDGLALLALAALVGLAGDEADVLGDALLDGLLGVVGDLCMGRKDTAHDAYDVGYGHVLVLFSHHANRSAGSGC